VPFHGWLGLVGGWRYWCGDLGFPPFALECAAMYHWLRGALQPGPSNPML
jgi:hypothetical protein